MKKLRDATTVPPKPYCYEHEDGFKQYSNYPHVLKQFVIDYRKANHLPIGAAFNEQFEEHLCAHADDGVCVEFIPPNLMQKASSLTKALVKWAATGFRVRTQEEVERILGICRSCEFYGGEKGLIKIACKRCGCSSKKVHIFDSHCPLPQPKW